MARDEEWEGIACHDHTHSARVDAERYTKISVGNRLARGYAVFEVQEERRPCSQIFREPKEGIRKRFVAVAAPASKKKGYLSAQRSPKW